MPKSLPNNEKGLLLQIANGNEAAFRQLINEHKQKIYSLGLHLTRSEFLAEEIVQEVCIKIWEHRETLANVNYINSWLRIVARNVCFDYLRNLAVEKLALKNLAEHKPVLPISPEFNYVNKEYEKILDDAINKLTPQQKKVYLLSRKYGMKQSEIAKQLSISVSTVKEYMKLSLRSIHHNIKSKINISELTWIVILTTQFSFAFLCLIYLY